MEPFNYIGKDGNDEQIQNIEGKLEVLRTMLHVNNSSKTIETLIQTINEKTKIRRQLLNGLKTDTSFIGKGMQNQSGFILMCKG